MQARLVFAIYRLLQLAAFPIIAVYLLVRCLKQPRYWRHLGERFGLLPRSFRQTLPQAIWLHAVSVGEVFSAVALVRRLREELPGAPVFVSVTTLAGRAVAGQKLGGLADGIFYAPLDYCFAARRVLRNLRPRVVAILETEIWPNLWREAKRAGAQLLVINGRISDRAFPRYARWRRWVRPVLELADAVLAQDATSRSRYLALGAPAQRVQVAGNLKYDFDPARVACPADLASFLERLKPAETWVAASTMPPAQPGDPDEDQAVIEAFQRLAPGHPGLLLVLAPRRPERFDAAARLLERAGVPFLRRSALEAAARLALPGVLLLDSVGELAALFAYADVVFMGGTLASRGGHNILEPACFGRAIVVGPHMENFPGIIEKFRASGAVMEICSASELAAAVDGLLREPDRRASLGERALRAATAEQGATRRALTEIRARYCAATPRLKRAMPVHVVLWLLSQAWLLGGWVKRRLQQRRRVRLSVPVVSVGALSMGGAGKTPFTIWLSEQLAARGWQPAVLIRGYRRRSRRLLVLGPGSDAPVELTGDEAQIHLRCGHAALGIGRDRAAAGRLLCERFHPEVILLDDGFQHWRVARDLDIVLVDALDPEDEPFPLGRLREALHALRRASAVVITRGEALPDPGPVIERIRRYNPGSPIYVARLEASAWVRDPGGERFPPRDPPFRRPVAFCGLAVPAAFWRSLRELGLALLAARSFRDHHRYSAADVDRLAQLAAKSGADALVTTQKDLMNLPRGWERLLRGLPLYWLELRLEVENGASLLAAVEECLAGHR